MTEMTLKEAIAELKELKLCIIGRSQRIWIDREACEAIDTVVEHCEQKTYTADEMYLNMQYYMEYCLMKGYVTPMKWLKKYKHFGMEAAIRDKASQDKVDYLKSAKQPSEITHPYDLSKK